MFCFAASHRKKKMWALANPKLIAAAVIAALAIGLLIYIKHLQSTNADLHASVAVLTNKLNEQNSAVAAWKADADARLKAAASDLARAKEQAAKNKVKAQVIYKTAPSTPGNDCKSALDLINGVAP